MAERSGDHGKAGFVPDRRTHNFDHVARIYRWAEYLLLGPMLRRTREHWLPAILGARHALVLGDGDGRFLAAYLRRSHDTRALAVDSSVAMLRLLQERCAFANSRLTTLHAEFNCLPSSVDLSRIDLVITHFALDCLSQHDLDRFVASLSSRLPAGALWVISDFGIPARQPWHTLATLYIRGLYLAFRLLTGLQTQSLPCVARTLAHHSFRRLHRSERMKGLLYSDLWQFAPVLRQGPGATGRATSPTLGTSTLK